jgi:hypothetical protein
MEVCYFGNSCAQFSCNSLADVASKLARCEGKLANNSFEANAGDISKLLLF